MKQFTTENKNRVLKILLDGEYFCEIDYQENHQLYNSSINYYKALNNAIIISGIPKMLELLQSLEDYNETTLKQIPDDIWQRIQEFKDIKL